MIRRDLQAVISSYLFKNKTIIVYGARQVGKTTMIQEMIAGLNRPSLFLNGDDADIRELFSNLSSSKLIPVFAGYDIVVLDEAQRIPDSGLVLKIIHDNFRKVQLIATGSSALEIDSKIKEPMTGRKYEFFLHPLSFNEMSVHHGFLTEKRALEHRLIYGFYPDVVTNPGGEKKILTTLASDYLYKDILSLGQIKKPLLLEKILKALAMQIGNEVSYHELAQLLDSDKGTIEKYIDLLEKTYIIFRLNGLNKNVRNEIKKGKKIYFCDNGIRNAILGNFQPINSRIDTGALWENFLISERQKLLSKNETDAKFYFWRTTQQQEIDYIEEQNGHYYAYEFKWNPLKQFRLSKTFQEGYPGSEFKVISPDNMHEFVI